MESSRWVARCGSPRPPPATTPGAGRGRGLCAQCAAAPLHPGPGSTPRHNYAPKRSASPPQPRTQDSGVCGGAGEGTDATLPAPAPALHQTGLQHRAVLFPLTLAALAGHCLWRGEVRTRWPAARCRPLTSGQSGLLSPRSPVSAPHSRFVLAPTCGCPGVSSRQQQPATATRSSPALCLKRSLLSPDIAKFALYRHALRGVCFPRTENCNISKNK